MRPTPSSPRRAGLALVAAISTMSAAIPSGGQTAAAPSPRSTGAARPAVSADSGSRLAPRSDPSLPELTEPGQTQAPDVYRRRREALMKEMGEGVAVVYARGEEDGDGYRQGSDLLYLTGVLEEGAVLVLAPKERTYREYLLLPSRDPEAERWTGEREAIGAALRHKYGFEKIYRTGRLMSLVLDLAGRSPVLWQVSRPESDAEGKPKDLALYEKIGDKLPGVSTKTLGWTLARMRSRHSADELAIMQRAIRISEAGFAAAVAAIRPGATEALLEAEAERVWKAAGARRPAYASIVGSGPNSTILHYPRSERTMEAGDLVLMDMSAEFAHYAADITRTFPVSGRFSAEQRKIYEVVLKAQKAAFALLRPGAYYEDLDAVARKVIEDAGYGDYFIHGLGHFVGLDVHDAGAYQEPLAPGMVITLEPGIYLPDRKVGIRIEDDVLVTETGARYLSDGIPREPDDVERWMASRRGR
jgi:Xaa-Pro aminopeptidase